MLNFVRISILTRVIFFIRIEFEETQYSTKLYKDKRQLVIVQENHLDNIEQQPIHEQLVHDKVNPHEKIELKRSSGTRPIIFNDYVVFFQEYDFDVRSKDDLNLFS
jgi:hypothetical protein